MASSTATRKRAFGADELDESDDDIDLDDFDDDADDDESDDDSDDPDDSDDEPEESDEEDDPEDEPAPELRDYYLDVSLDDNGDGTKRSPFNTPAALKGVRLAPGATLFVRSRTTVEGLELSGNGTLEQPITLAPYGHGPVPRFIIPNEEEPVVARDFLTHNGFIFRGWIIKGIKMEPSIAALTGELERMRREGLRGRGG